VKVGSAAPVTIDAATGTGTQSRVFSATGSNTVTITGTGGEPVFYGAAFQTSSDGVHGWNLGQSGSRVDTWAYGDPAWGAPDSEVPAMQALGLIKPHLVVIALGANGLGGIFGQDYPPKQYATDMAALVTNVRAAVMAAAGTEPGCLRITPAQLVDNMGTSREHYWLGFERELRRAFQGDGLVSILHESDVWAPVSKTAPDPAGYLADSVHWSDVGMAAVGDFVKTWLARGFSDAPEAAQAVTAAQDAATAAASSVTAAQQAADAAEAAENAKFLTQDEGVATLVGDSTSDTRAALTTAVGDMVDAEVSTAVGRMLIDATTHGVVGDGTTNVAAPLNTLISDTSAAGGGVIVLPVGTYICIGGVNGASNVTLRGADRDGTIIRKSGSNSTWINTGSSSNFRIENLTIDGNGGVTTRGITFSSGSMD